MVSPDKTPVIEIFGPTIQGEGIMAGMRTMFLRTGGCDFNCKMCDSRIAIDQDEIRERAQYMTQDEIYVEITNKMGMTNTKWITLSGGNPCLWDLSGVISTLQDDGFQIALETQGSYCPEWVQFCDQVTISPKGPGMGEGCNLTELSKFMRPLLNKDFEGLVIFKVVCFSTRDIDFAKTIMALYPQVSMFFSVGNRHLAGTPVIESSHQQVLLDSYKWLVEETLKDSELADVIVLPQLHVLIWGNEESR